MAETTKLQADAGPTTLPVYASGAHELGKTPEPLAGSSSVGTNDPGHQQTENFDIKTLDAHIQRTLTLRPLDANNQRSLTLMNSWPSLLDDYSEAGFNKAPGCPLPEREDFDVDGFVALPNDNGKAGHCLFS